MSAVRIIRGLLMASPEVSVLVPAAQIRIGASAIGSALPLIVLTDVSGSEIPTMARNLSVTTIRARVQVTVYARSYAQQEEILLACKLGRGVHSGVVDGFLVQAVEPAGVGPAIPPAGDGIFERSRDFMVTFREAN